MDTTPTAELLAAVERAIATALDGRSERKLYSPDAAADALGVSRSTVYSLMKSGALRFVRVNADRRIPADEIERVMREGIA